MFKAKSLLFFIFFFIGYTSTIAQSKYPSILWEIKKTKSSKPSYLFGTYHISSKGVFNLGDSIFYALKNVDIIAKEVNANTWQRDQNTTDEMQYDYARYTNELRKPSFNKNTISRTNTIEKLPLFISAQPSFVNYFLFRNGQGNEGYEEEMFLDKFISSAGYKYGKEVKGLENYMQSNILYLQAQKDQADLEKIDRKQLPDGLNYEEMNDKIYDGYLNHNLDAMDSFMVYQYESEAFYNKFLKERNYNQADSMDYYIKTGKTIFAAVGAAHLPGNDGVIEIMRKKGYSVRPVKLKFSNTDELEAVKKKIVPLKNSLQNIDDVITVKAPGIFYTYEKTDIIKSYGYVDMSNSAFYYVCRLYNNAAYFNYGTKKVSSAIDSLLFSNIKGDIVEKSFSVLDGYNCVNVTTKVKNKDIERYKFVITPYEIIKFQVGGKNEFAKAPFVDEFFNSIKILAPQKLSNNYSFKFKIDYPLHEWNTTLSNNMQTKQKYTYYDSANKQLNSFIKIIIPEGKTNNDSLISHILRESFLSSESFPKNYLYDNNKFPLANNQINKLNLTTGQTMLLKYQINPPYVYLLSSLRAENPTVDFINAFELKVYNITNKYLYTDSSRGFKVTLPYAQEFDKTWKYEMERKKKKYEDEKNPNDDENIFYKPQMYTESYEIDKLSFVDNINLESIDLVINRFEKDSYFTNATQFWKKIITPFTESYRTYNYNDYGDEYEVYSDNEEDYLALKHKKKSINLFGIFEDYKDKTTVENIVYDTLNNKIQGLSFYVIDSTNKNKTFHQYKLNNENLYHLNFVQYNSEKTAFQKLITESFTPLQNDKSIHIYNTNFKAIVNEYKKANLNKRPSVLKRLNNLYLGISDLPAIDSVFKKNTKNVPEENILRRKLMDMVADGLYEKKDWTTISTWLKNIFSNENELVTLRKFALKSIIHKYDSTDATWLIDNIYKPNSIFLSSVSGEINSYFKYTNPKTYTIPNLPLILKEKSDIGNLELIDSGYYTTAEKENAFEFYKKKLEDGILDLKLSQEKNGFEFNESEINETLTNNQKYSEFGQLVAGFRYFYALKPNDPFFADALNKILVAKADRDLLILLRIFLKQPNPDYSKVDKIVAQVGKENKNLFELNEVFERNKKYDKLPAKFKDKKQLAKYFLLGAKAYNKLDSITFIGVEKYPYATGDSIYLFKYISDKEENANIAYVVLDSKNEYLKNKPDFEFTTEQITKTEPYDKVVKKLIRQSYSNTFFYSNGNYYQYSNLNKSLNSEE